MINNDTTHCRSRGNELQIVAVTVLYEIQTVLYELQTVAVHPCASQIINA